MRGGSRSGQVSSEPGHSGEAREAPVLSCSDSSAKTGGSFATGGSCEASFRLSTLVFGRQCYGHCWLHVLAPCTVFSYFRPCFCVREALMWTTLAVPKRWARQLPHLLMRHPVVPSHTGLCLRTLHHG